jgi:hypothetical protein
MTPYVILHNGLANEVDARQNSLQQKGAYCDPNILANNKEIRF